MSVPKTQGKAVLYSSQKCRCKNAYEQMQVCHMYVNHKYIQMFVITALNTREPSIN